MSLPGTDMSHHTDALCGGACFLPQARPPPCGPCTASDTGHPYARSFVGQRKDCDLGSAVSLVCQLSLLAVT